MARSAHLGFLLVACFALLLVPACGGGGGGSSPAAVPPAVSSITPTAGFQTGGTLVTVTGSGFAAGVDSVVIGGAPTTGLVVVNDTTLTCTTGANGSSGPSNVVVTGPGGVANLPDAFRYVSFPPATDPLGDQQVDTDATASLGEAPIVLCEGQNIYVAWIEDRGSGSMLFFNRSVDGGASFEPLDTTVSTAGNVPVGVRMFANGNTIYVVWVETTGTVRTVMNASSDGGVTWLANDVTVSQTAASTAQGFWHGACLSGDTLTVVWPSGSNLYAQQTSDFGSTWLANDVQITDAGAAPSGRPALCCSGSTVHLIWLDNRNAAMSGLDLYYDRSTDGGATWGADTRIDNGPALSGVGPAEICCSGNQVHAVWLDFRTTTHSEVYVNSSTDAGLTWNANDVQASDNPASFGASSLGVCCDGPLVAVTWMDSRAGATEPYVATSTDGGTTFPNHARLNTGSAAGTTNATQLLLENHQRNSRICCSGNIVHVCWTDNRTAGQTDVFLNTSTDGGMTWLSNDVRLDTDAPNPGSTVAGPPGICCRGPLAYIVWRDDRNNVGSGTGDIAFQRTVE